jgi:hypothetical protein
VIAKVQQVVADMKVVPPGAGPFTAARAGFEAALNTVEPAKAAAPLKDVVLSDFSRGRALMTRVRKNATGLDQYLREVWDFDGNGAAPPLSSGGVRGILYDQVASKTKVKDTFHVPLERWEGYLGKKRVSELKKLSKDQQFKEVHPHIVGQLVRHAASISHVGKA